MVGILAIMTPGTVINQRYVLVEPFGRGGMGAVWRATQLSVNAPVAVKLINAELAKSTRAIARFELEARAVAALRSAHVVQLIDFGVDDALGLPFIVMELLEGESLAQRLRKQGQLSVPQTTLVLTHVCRAIARAHAVGIIHRDLKPDNIFIVTNEEEPLVKLLDFGIAKFAQPGNLSHATDTGAVVGTAFYMSPEQIRGDAVDSRADLWALGVVAFECLTGTLPFPAATIGELTLQICIDPIPLPSASGRVPTRFDSWCVKALHRDKEQRFQTARELLEAFVDATGARLNDAILWPTSTEPRPDASARHSIGDGATEPFRPTARTTNPTIAQSPAASAKRSQGALSKLLFGVALVGALTTIGVWLLGSKLPAPLNTTAGIPTLELSGSKPVATNEPTEVPEDNEEASIAYEIGSSAALETIGPARTNDPKTSRDPSSKGRPSPSGVLPTISKPTLNDILRSRKH